MSSFSWTPFTVERLPILRAQGLMLSKIAADLGTTIYAIGHSDGVACPMEPTLKRAGG
jgi:hypothetical protein